jgi:hypothetical protein
MKKLLAPVFVLLAVLLLGGCTSQIRISTAGVGISATRLERLDNGDLRVTWTLRNPNIVAYVFTRSTHKLWLDGTEVGTLTSTARVGLPSLNQVEAGGILTPANPAAPAAIERAAEAGSAGYRMESVFWLLVLDDKTEKVALSSSGTVAVTRE